MSFKNKYLWFLVLTVIGYGLFEYYRPKPIDWNPTYTNKDKIPFGTKATYELLGDVFEQQKIQTVRVPIYNHLKDSKLPTLSNYVFVCRNFTIDKNDQAQLLSYIAKGNHVFISAYYYSDSLMNELGVKDELKAPTLRDTALVMNFVNPRIRRANGYVFRHDDGRNYFEIKKTEKVTVLAKNARNEPIFVKVAYGKGVIYLHNLPLSLTNYYVLDHQMSDFAFKSLSYLPNRPVYWDEYQKQGRFGDDEQSLLRYVMTQPALQWSYYIVLALLLLFAIFAGKRTQRIIPIVEPPQNTSLAFIDTIGRMYYQQADHGNIAQKKIQYLLAFIRNRFGLNTNVLDNDFRKELANKTDIDYAEITALFDEIMKAQKTPFLSDYSLLLLNQQIENFREKTKR